MIRLPCRTLLASAAARPLFAIRSRPADAAEFTYKYANNSPMTHPLTVRTTEAAARVKGEGRRAGGKPGVREQSADSDTDMLSQLRSGALEFFTLSGPILSTLVPVASINGVGFAFKDYSQLWPTMDGAGVRRHPCRRIPRYAEEGRVLRGMARQVRPRGMGRARVGRRRSGLILSGAALS